MTYFSIHILIHILLILSSRRLIPIRFKNFFTKNNHLTIKGQIKVVFFMAGIPFTIGALINTLLQLDNPFAYAQLIVTLSYLVHCKSYISYLKANGVVVEERKKLD